MPVFLLSKRVEFPSPHRARQDGLLAVGGDLSQERLLLAYQMGIFPWYAEGDPIIWWSPDPRLVIYPDEFQVSRSLRKLLRQQKFHITFDRAFHDVIIACATVRLNNGEGTWITDEMATAYCALHEAGFAHSAEAWRDGKLVGGLYGVSLGRVFFGESMFTRESNASKAAFATLAAQLKAWRFHLIDCQIKTDHLVRFGAREVPRERFLSDLGRALRHRTVWGKWGQLIESRPQYHPQSF